MLVAFFLGLSQRVLADGARLYKSGPIQITADGRWVWTANEDNDSVSRIDTTNDDVDEIALPADEGPHRPRGLSVKEDGSEVWVVCHDSDRVYVLDGDGTIVARIDLPWGSGPHSVALSRDQSTALVTLHRAASVAMIDVDSHTLSHILAPTFWSPTGICWTEDGDDAWGTHIFAPGEHPLLTRVDVSGPEPRVGTSLQVFATDPRHSSDLAETYDIAEDGYPTTRGHPAQIPSATGRNEIWLPIQYNNISEDIYTPDSTVQATIRQLDLDTRRVPNDNDDKVILTAVHVHDPSSGNAYGDTTYFLSELSNDLLVLASSTPAVKPTGADDDGELALTDGIRILNVLFLGQGEIAPPGFEDCGEDPTAEEPPLPTCVYEAC
jgi:hypothetical protein